MTAVDSLLALARGNGGAMTVMSVGTWLKEIDGAREVTPAVRTWRATLRSRFPSAHQRPHVELDHARRGVATQTVEKMRKEMAELSKLASVPGRREERGAASFPTAVIEALLRGYKATLAPLEKIACVDWTPCLEELATLERAYRAGLDAVPSPWRRTTLTDRPFTPEELTALEAKGSVASLEATLRAMRRQAEVRASL